MEKSHTSDHLHLIHWTYTRQEWKNFVRWTKRKQSLFHYVVHYFSFPVLKQTPEVKITPERVTIGEGHHHFNNEQHKLKRINIRDEGNMNIMEITYEHTRGRFPELGEIRFPVPKGKLREAIAMQEKIINRAEER